MKKGLLFLGLCVMLLGMAVPGVTASAQELEEHTAHITDPEFAGVLEEMVGNTFSTMSKAYSIDWSIRKNCLKATSYFSKDVGTEVAIGFRLSGYGYAGIMDFDGNIRYVDGTDLSHVFVIKKKNVYCVIVQNRSGSKITAKGNYAR